MASLITACGPVGITFASETTVWISRATWELVYPLTFLAMLAIPASIATAVWKEQLFDVRVVVRRGLQYLFARAALRTLLALPIALLVFSIVSNPNRTVAEILTQGSGWLNLLLIGAIAATLQSRQRLQSSLDRRFFREAYQQEQVLVQLIDEVRQRDSLAEIARLVSTRIDSVLHPTSLHVLYRAQERSETVRGPLLVRLAGHSSAVAATHAAAIDRRREGDPRLSNRLQGRAAGQRTPLDGEPGRATHRADHRNARSPGRHAAAGRTDVGRAVFRDRPPPAAGHRRADRPRLRESAPQGTRPAGRRRPARRARAAGRSAASACSRNARRCGALLRQRVGALRARRRGAHADAADRADARRQVPARTRAGARRLRRRVRSLRPAAAAPGWRRR